MALPLQQEVAGRSCAGPKTILLAAGVFSVLSREHCCFCHCSWNCYYYYYYYDYCYDYCYYCYYYY